MACPQTGAVASRPVSLGLLLSLRVHSAFSVQSDSMPLFRVAACDYSFGGLSPSFLNPNVEMQPGPRVLFRILGVGASHLHASLETLGSRHSNWAVISGLHVAALWMHEAKGSGCSLFQGLELFINKDGLLLQRKLCSRTDYMH